MKTKRKQVPKAVSEYFSQIGKNGYKAKVKKLLSQKPKVAKQSKSQHIDA